MSVVKTLNKIANDKAKKIELSRQFVELGAAQDAEKLVGKINKQIATIKKAESSIDGEISKFEAAIDKTVQKMFSFEEKVRNIYQDDALEKEAISTLNKLESAAKELGVKATDLPAYQKLDKAGTDLQLEGKKLNDSISLIDKSIQSI
jgi:predicted  nucleic acid-binding Zn-ribbon protein